MTARSRPWLVPHGLAVLALVMIAAAAPGVSAASAPVPVTLTLYAAIDQGSPHWFPAAVTVTAGTPLTLVLVNTLRRLHWFALAGTNIAVAIPGGATRTTAVEIDTPGTYRFFDPHDPRLVGGVLIVLQKPATP